MAYTAKRRNTQQVPCEPGVLSVYCPNSAAESNILVDIPWKNCQLSHAYAAIVTAIDTVGNMVVDLELDAAGGGDMMSIAVTGAAGTQVDATVDSQARCENLDRDNADRDKINIEIDGSTTGTGAAMIYMYFEPWYGE